MVELKLDLVKGSGTNQSDCFVSVRVGEVQKLSRLTSSRTYRFPKGADQQYGKIEVFRRVGVTAVHINSLSQEVREVSVPFGDGSDTIGFKVSVDGGDLSIKDSQKPKEISKADDDATEARKVKAKEYLQKHCIEVCLSEAMQALLRERPDNPTQFLASALLNYTSSVPLSPAAGAAPPPLPNERPGGAGYADEAPAGKSAPPPEPEEATESQPKAMPPAAQKNKSKAFSTTGFLRLPPAGLQRMYARFPRFRQRAVPVKPLSKPPHSKQAFTTTGFLRLPLAGLQKMYARFPRFRQRAIPVKPLPKPPYSKQALFATCAMRVPSAGFEKVYARFPRFRQRAVPAVPIQAAPAAPNYGQQASVGTWLMPRFQRASETKVDTERPPHDWCKMPSVGSWLQQRLPTEEVVEADADEGTRKMWTMKPSVGSWLQPIFYDAEALHEDQHKLWSQKASVGTWLQPLFCKDEPTDAKEKPMMLVPQSFVRGTDFIGSGFMLI